MWFVAERYIHCITGISRLFYDGHTKFEHKFGYKTFEPSKQSNKISNLTAIEMEGLRHLYIFLRNIGFATSHHIAQVDLLHQSLRVYFWTHNQIRVLEV